MEARRRNCRSAQTHEEANADLLKTKGDDYGYYKNFL